MKSTSVLTVALSVCLLCSVIVRSQEILYEQIQGEPFVTIPGYRLVEQPNNDMIEHADDIVIQPSETWTIGHIQWMGMSNVAGPDITPFNWVVRIYSSHLSPFTGSYNVPNEVLYEATVIPDNGVNSTSPFITLPEPQVLTEGRYWFSVTPNLPGDGEQKWSALLFDTKITPTPEEIACLRDTAGALLPDYPDLWLNYNLIMDPATSYYGLQFILYSPKPDESIPETTSSAQADTTSLIDPDSSETTADVKPSSSSNSDPEVSQSTSVDPEPSSPSSEETSNTQTRPSTATNPNTEDEASQGYLLGISMLWVLGTSLVSM